MKHISSNDIKNNQKSSQTGKNYTCVSKQGWIVFRDEINQEWVWIPDANGCQEKQLKIESKAFFRYLNKKLLQRKKPLSSKKKFKARCDFLIACIPDTLALDISPRFYAAKEFICIDLVNAKNEMIKLDKAGWKICPIEEPLFDRPAGMKTLPTPAREGDIWELFNYVNIPDKDDQLLVLVWLVAALDRSVAKMMLVIIGSAGSGKTLVCHLLRSLIDPHTVTMAGAVRGDSWKTIMQTNAVVGFDNLGTIDNEKSNLYCRAITGDALQERKLRTDSDSVFYKFRRPILINGIHSPVAKTDLMDRSIQIEMKRVESFVPSEDLESKFEAARPRLLGALLNLAVQTRQYVTNEQFKSEFRMASFAKIGRQVALALGMDSECFDRVLRKNQQSAEMNLVEETPLGECVIELSGLHTESKPWMGTVTELIVKLHEECANKNLLKLLPIGPRNVSIQLKDLAKSLVNHGTYIMQLPRTNAKRLWKIYSKPNADTAQSIGDEEVDFDTEFGPSGDSITGEDTE